VSHCTSCKAEIIWAKTSNGKMTPLDAEMVKGGEWIIVDGAAIKLSPMEMVLGQNGRMSHLATCPNRKARKKVKL
jgi:hypothetical protein